MDLFRPLDVWGISQENLIQVLLDGLAGQEVQPLDRPLSCKGTPGVYLIYYDGPFPRYESIRSPDASTPIYVGKTKDLDNRVRSHCRTLDQVFNLDRADFQMRVLPLPDLWTELVEKVFMEKFQPWWNQRHFSGFGNDGTPRASGKASNWEILHPGRRRSLVKARPPEAEAQKLFEKATHDAALLGGQDQGVIGLLEEAGPLISSPVSSSPAPSTFLDWLSMP